MRKKLTSLRSIYQWILENKTEGAWIGSDEMGILSIKVEKTTKSSFGLMFRADLAPVVRGASQDEVPTWWEAGLDTDVIVSTEKRDDLAKLTLVSHNRKPLTIIVLRKSLPRRLR